MKLKKRTNGDLFTKKDLAQIVGDRLISPGPRERCRFVEPPVALVFRPPATSENSPISPTEVSVAQSVAHRVDCRIDITQPVACK